MLTAVVGLVWDAIVDVLEAVLQSNPMLWKPMLQDGLLPAGTLGRMTETFFAPPHWLLLTVVPPVEQDAVCLQVVPSSIP